MPLTTVVPPPRSSTPRPRAAGKWLFVGTQRLEVRGVTYGTFSPNGVDGPFPPPRHVMADFTRMTKEGFNAVRVYCAPPRWFLDLAQEAGLRVMVGLAWEQHVAFLESRETARATEARVRAELSPCVGHPAILCYAIGNEIPSAIVRWSGRREVEAHLERLYRIVKEREGDVPVTYVNYPSTEYLDLPFLDLVAFNVFLETREDLRAYLARLQNLAGLRPLLLTELGLDSRRYGLDRQAQLVAEQILTVREEGAAGSFVFSWTDEWHRGGWEVVDWDFGLTTRDRKAKPALRSATAAWAQPLQPPVGGWPRVSVVVCVHNGARWLEDCLQGLAEVRYPDFEVVVVDDGSSDETPSIMARHDVRGIRTPNRGLSAARNTGIEAATGEVVAYIDSDARPDPDWLTHLAMAFRSSDFAGIGGPNIAPAGDGSTAACVANAPGIPVHVLRTDREAEHIPGCNMAFRRSALQRVGGFDPAFRVAGDDVDICWRLQAEGFRLGYCPAAVVWHHPRSTLTDFWKQQRGYGAAEVLLEAKWPERYNSLGHVTWGGRVYGMPALGLLGRHARVYQGIWGEAAYQRMEYGQASPLWEMAATPEWYLLLITLLAVSLLGPLWHPLLVALPAFLLGASLTAIRAIRSAKRARYLDSPIGEAEERRRYVLVVLLHLVQPAARLAGRLRRGLGAWKLWRRGPIRWPRARLLEFWREEGEEVASTLRRIAGRLARSGRRARHGSGYEPWDLQLGVSGLCGARLGLCLEEHGHGRQLLRARVRPHLSGLAWGGLLAGSILGIGAWMDHAWSALGILGCVTGLMAIRIVQECGSAVSTLAESVQRSEIARSGEVEARKEKEGQSGRGKDEPGLLVHEVGRRVG